MNICFFCGPTENPLTEEHVWPKWVSKLLFGRFASNHFVHVRSTGDNTTALWKARYLDVTTNTVCDKCNNVWLSRFENDVIKPLATPLIVGDAPQLISPADQWHLAAWAYKMAMLLEGSIPDRERPPLYFTAAERKQFRDTTLPHERVRVFVSKYELGQHPVHAQLPQHKMTERDGEHRAHLLGALPYVLLLLCPDDAIPSTRWSLVRCSWSVLVLCPASIPKTAGA